ncbi:MAG TPA: glycoside hydrolase family 38 C-terminal domain-containing protein [Phycisphaerae bacterium]|nr:glycoside hydrolase family 38 C-terminal domain-containing protein [Phycisphaerae bacterium]HRY68032.1 glycoside hydrolase family 38 C-terminal domain-containing protein [Phycisphaerae bacterium]HSA28688.1 glycoside hydrolase family 38 C-terminal domain-containing protein [Phycisphaerae bacterium]
MRSFRPGVCCRPRVVATLVLLTWATLQVAGAGEPAVASKPALKEVVVVFKTHFDIGYTDLARNVLGSYRTSMVDKALAVCDASRSMPPEQRFVWTIPGWPLSEMIGAGQTVPRRERVLEMMRAGRFVWHALPFTTHTESLDLEDLVRGLGFSSRMSRSLGQPLPRDAKMTDVPSHAWALPTVLSRAGVEFLHLGCNSGSTPPATPTLFWWEGPDGSRLLTMLVHGYGTGLHPPKDWPHATWLALIHTGDNVGPPSPESVRRLLEQAGRELPGVHVRMGRLSDFSDAIRKEHPELPVVRADMPDSWIHGVMAMPIETGIARRVRPAIGALEAIHALGRAWGLDVPEVHDRVAKSYEGSLLYGEHTWGIDIKKFGQRLYGEAWTTARAKGTYAKAEESFVEKGDHIRWVEGLVLPALDEQVSGLARAVAVEGTRVVVFNPLPWRRHGVVTVKWPGTRPQGLREASGSGQVVAESEGDMIRFIARDLPPLGYRTYTASEAPAGTDSGLQADTADATLENAFLRLRVDAGRGCISSLVDKATDRELAASDDGGLGRYLYERFDSEDLKRYLDAYTASDEGWVIAAFGKPNLPPAAQVPHVSAWAGDFDLAITRGPVSAVAAMTPRGSPSVPHAVSLRVVLYRDLPWVDLEWSIGDKSPDPWPEAGWLCLPFAIDSPSFRLGRLGAIIDPAADVQPLANRDVFCLSTGLTLTGAKGAGVGLCPLDSPLVSLGQPGLWRFSKEYASVGPRVYVNLFNNQWSTNFQQWIGGSWTSRIRVWSVAGSRGEDGLIGPAWEGRSPCRAGVFDGPAGSLPPTQAGVELSRRGVLVTALGDNPDGGGTVLRLWEQAGEGGLCRVTLPKGMKVGVVRPCDLRGGSIGEPIAVHGGQFEVEVPAFAPVSLLLASGS